MTSHKLTVNQNHQQSLMKPPFLKCQNLRPQLAKHLSRRCPQLKTKANHLSKHELQPQQQQHKIYPHPTMDLTIDDFPSLLSQKPDTHTNTKAVLEDGEL